jgi:predicted RNA binding protein with dsRBD fold (UPF0201 family)
MLAKPWGKSMTLFQGKSAVSRLVSGAAEPTQAVVWNGVATLAFEAMKPGVGIAGAIALIKPTIAAPVIAAAAICGLFRYLSGRRTEARDAEIHAQTQKLARKAGEGTDILQSIADGTIELKVDVDQLVKQDIAAVVDDILGKPGSSVRLGLKEEVETTLAQHPRLSEIEGHLSTLVGGMDELRILGWTAVDLIRKLSQKLNAPSFGLPTPDKTDEGGRFVYRNERLTVVGRDAEIIELNAFLDDPRPFVWDLWTGPSGAGKSRLALHVCRQRVDPARAGGAWDAGFYNWLHDAQVRWDQWTPTKPTLIVFDYVAEHAARIAAIIATLANRSWHSGARVRLLLLEREVVRRTQADSTAAAGAAVPHERRGAAKIDRPISLPAWLTTLVREGEKCGAAFKETHQRRNTTIPERAVGGVDEKAVVLIVAQDSAQAKETRDVPTIRARCIAAASVDPRLRPLFIAMTAEAMRDAGPSAARGVDAWDFATLVSHIERKERDRWAKALAAHGVVISAAVKELERLACLATMTRGLSEAKLRQALGMSAACGVPAMTHWGNGAHYGLLISGVGGTWAPPLEPDVVGEAFVLSTLESDSMMADALVDAAWSLGMSEFVARAAQNFPTHPQVNLLLKPGVGRDATALAAAQTVLGEREWERGDIDALRRRGKALASNPAQPARVRALGVLMWMQGTADPDEIEAVHTIVKAFTSEELADSSIREQLAGGLVNAIADVKTDVALVDGLLSELRKLVTAGEIGATVRHQLAKGLVNAIGHTKTDVTRVDRLLRELRQLLAHNAIDAAIRDEFAKGLANAIVCKGIDKTPTDGLLGELRGLATAHPKDAALNEALAVGLTHAIAHGNTDVARVDDLFGELRLLGIASQGDHPVQARVLRGCGAAVYARLRHGIVAAEPLRYAIGLVPSLPQSEEAVKLANGILTMAQAAVNTPTGQENADFKTATEDFRAAFEAHFKTPLTKGT